MSRSFWLVCTIASGRMGAKTVLFDRFGSSGGNIGPGMVFAESIIGPIPESRESIPEGPSGIPKGFFERFNKMKTTPGYNYAE